MTLSVNQQKVLKIFHLLFASLWFASVVTMTSLTALVNGLDNGDQFYMLTRIYHFIDFKILTPAAIGTLLTGLTYSLLTKWGFFKHGWLVYKWILTVALILIGTFYLGPMTDKIVGLSSELRLVALSNELFLSKWNIALWAGWINGLLLLIAFVVSTLKPWKNIRK